MALATSSTDTSEIGLAILPRLSLCVDVSPGVVSGKNLSASASAFSSLLTAILPLPFMVWQLGVFGCRVTS